MVSVSMQYSKKERDAAEEAEGWWWWCVCVCVCAQPATVGCRNGSSVGIRTRCVHVFACLAPICMPRSVLINKISATELRRKFIKSALLVGVVGLINEEEGECTESL